MVEIKDWFKKARSDLKAAEINLGEGLYDVSSFLSQQAAEKALMAVYILKFKRLWKIHDLGALAKKIGAPEEILTLCNDLTEHYLSTRYPTEAEYKRPDAEEALMQSRRVVEWAGKRL